MYTNRISLGLVALTSFALCSGSAFANFTVSKKPTENVSCSAGICSATARKAVLNVADLTGMLASGDVTLQSRQIARDIAIETGISWTSSHRLTLDSYRSIAFDRPVSVAGSPGALTITTNDGGSDGDFVFKGNGHVRIWDRESSLTINGVSYELLTTFRHIGRRGGNLALAKSIDLTGTVYPSAPLPTWGGTTFEGLGNEISNLTVHDTSNNLVGLIGDFEGGAGAIRDLRLVSVNIRGGDGSGVGAIAAESLGRIVNCSASGVVVGGDNSFVGGLVGVNGANILNSANSTAVTGGNDSTVGGLIGDAEEGGFQAQDYSTGSVTGGKDAMVGGLIGSSATRTDNSYATGSVTGGNRSEVGGLVGANTSGPYFTLYSTGAVNGGTGAVVGGVIGKDIQNSSISDAYWDLDTSGISDPSKGAGNIPNDPGITGLGDAQLKAALPAGFDPSVWGQSAGVNGGYPYLLAHPPQ